MFTEILFQDRVKKILQKARPFFSKVNPAGIRVLHFEHWQIKMHMWVQILCGTYNDIMMILLHVNVFKTLHAFISRGVACRGCGGTFRELVGRIDFITKY